MWQNRIQVQNEVFCKITWSVASSSSSIPTLPLVDSSMLTNPTQYGSNARDKAVFVGRGSFGVVKFQQYRGIQVAVKEFLPHTRAESVRYEASILLKLSHPYVPLLLGICTSKYPFIMVIQYHGIDGRCVTLYKELTQRIAIPSGTYQSWIILCSELAEAIQYLYDDVNIIQKADNVVLSNSFTQQSLHSNLNVQIVVIDCGKATEKDRGHLYTLNFHEKQQYHLRYHHLATELIEDTMKQCVLTVYSQMYTLLGSYWAE